MNIEFPLLGQISAPPLAPTQSNFIGLKTELCWAANLLKKSIISNMFLQMKYF